MMKKWYVYILTNYKNSVFYTGVTNNVKRRIWEHKNGIDKNSFTAKYKLYKLVWFEAFQTPIDAISTEKRVKDFRREKKILLIQNLNPKFQDLYKLN